MNTLFCIHCPIILIINICLTASCILFVDMFEDEIEVILKKIKKIAVSITRVQHRFQNITCQAGQADPKVDLPCQHFQLPCTLLNKGELHCEDRIHLQLAMGQVFLLHADHINTWPGSHAVLDIMPPPLYILSRFDVSLKL